MTSKNYEANLRILKPPRRATCKTYGGEFKELREDFRNLETKVDRYFAASRDAHAKILQYIKKVTEHDKQLDRHEAEIGLLKTAWLQEHSR